jgi:iron complex outermembrane recepter protein
LTPIDKLKITLGARYTENSRTLFATQNSAASIAFSGAPTPPLLGFTENANFSQVTPRVVFAYDFDPVDVYASYNKGFKAGGFSTPALAAVVNGVVALPKPIQSETVDDYELGAKYVSPDRRLKVDQSIFFYRYSNIQVDVDNSAAAPTIQNAASARGYGADLDSSYQVVESLKVIGDVAYLQTRYTSFPEASVSIVAPDGSLANGSENLTGHRLPNAPTLSGSLGFNLKTPISPGFLANLNAVAHYTNGYDLQPGGGGPLGYAVQPSYTELNISGYIEPKNLQNGATFLGLKDYKIGFYITNATDRQFYNGRFMITGTFGGLVDQVAQPRMFGLRVSASF